MKNTLLTLLAVPFLAIGVHAEDKPAAPEKPGKAEQPKYDPAVVFKKLDANNDASLSLEEFKTLPRFKKDASKADEAFKRKDTNADGKLSLEEFSAKPAKPAAPVAPVKPEAPVKPDAPK